MPLRMTHCIEGMLKITKEWSSQLPRKWWSEIGMGRKQQSLFFPRLKIKIYFLGRGEVGGKAKKVGRVMGKIDKGN